MLLPCPTARGKCCSPQPPLIVCTSLPHTTAALDLHINIVVTKGLGLELVLVELEPGIRSINLESR